MMKQPKPYDPTMRADYAIMERIKEDEQLSNADLYDRKMKNLGISADWYEKNKKMEVSKSKRLNEKNIHSDLQFTSKEIKFRRRQRLYELYLAEMAQYEKELNQRGLAIVKER